MSKKICVVGAGTVGLSCALRIVEEFGSAVSVNIVAELFLSQTTSYGSGGLWEPYAIAGTPDEDVNKWGKYAFDHFLELHHGPDCAKVIIILTSNINLFLIFIHFSST